MRKQDKIIQMLKDEESKLWVSLKNSELVFGREHEATKMARARWSTTLEILKRIENENA